MKKIFKIILYIFILIFLLAIISSIFSYYKIDVSQYNIFSEKINEDFDGYKIIFLSDLHNRDITDELVNIINKEDPNIILMGGDMTDDEEYDNFIKLINQIKEYKIYYVYGNHEENMDEEYFYAFNGSIENKIRILDNEKIELYSDESKINLYGLWYPLTYYVPGYDSIIDESYIVDELGEIENDEYNILLTHNPLFYEAYSNWGVDIVLCGHIHGGVVRIPGLGGIFSPDFTFFPKYSSGVNDIGDMKLIVSRGLGYGNQIKVRINNPGEVVIVNLKEK